MGSQSLINGFITGWLLGPKKILTIWHRSGDAHLWFLINLSVWRLITDENPLKWQPGWWGRTFLLSGILFYVNTGGGGETGGDCWLAWSLMSLLFFNVTPNHSSTLVNTSNVIIGHASSFCRVTYRHHQQPGHNRQYDLTCGDHKPSKK